MNAKPVTRGPAAGRRARMATAGVAASAALLTSACAAGRLAQTANQAPTQDGVNATVRNMALRGLAIEAPTGNPYYLPGSTARLRLVLVNTGTATDALTGLSTSSASGWGNYSLAAGGAAQTTANTGASAAAGAGSAAPAASSGAQTVVVGAGSRASFGVPDATRVLLLRATKGKLYPGASVKITFTFARAGDVTVEVPVQLSATPGTETVEPAAGSSGSG